MVTEHDPKLKPFICTYCGIHMSSYVARRAEWEGCPNCGKLNTVEMRS